MEAGWCDTGPPVSLGSRHSRLHSASSLPRPLLVPHPSGLVLHSLSPSLPPAELKKQVESAELKNQRLKEVFQTKIQEFRKACYTLTGYQIDITTENQYRLTSLYAEHPGDCLIFKVGPVCDCSLAVCLLPWGDPTIALGKGAALRRGWCGGPGGKEVHWAVLRLHLLRLHPLRLLSLGPTLCGFAALDPLGVEGPGPLPRLSRPLSVATWASFHKGRGHRRVSVFSGSSAWGGLKSMWGRGRGAFQAARLRGGTAARGQRKAR